jgi:acetolactate synthase small subunit
VSAAESESRSTWCFSVFAAPEPGVIPRVLELFAKRGLVPARFHGDRIGDGIDGLVIDVHAAGLDASTAEHVAACLRGLVDVERVLVATKRPVRTASFAGVL